MVDLCQVVKWSGIQMVVWKPDWKKTVHGPKFPVFKWSAKSHDFTLPFEYWTAITVGIQVFGIQMVYDVTRATLFSKINILFQETRKGHMATTFSQIKVDSSLGDLPRGDLRTLMDESDDYDNGN